MVTVAPSDSDFHRGDADQWLVAATSSPSKQGDSLIRQRDRHVIPASGDKSRAQYSFSPEMANQSRPASTPS